MFYNSETHKLSYLPIPKCASTSIQKAIGSSEQNKTHLPKYPSFTVVRNPLDRFYSGYHELIKRELFKGTPQQLLDKISKEGFFDPHIIPQMHYINYNVQHLYTIDQIPFKVPHLNRGKINYQLVDMAQFITVYKQDATMWHNRMIN